MKAEIEAGMHQNNFGVQSKGFRFRYFHSTEDSAVMTQSKALHGVLVLCDKWNKMFQTKLTSPFHVHALMEGGIFFPLALFYTPAILRVFYHLHTPQNTLFSPPFLSHRSYWDSPNPMLRNSVTAKDIDNIQSKAKPSINGLSLLVGIQYGLVWFMGKSRVSWKPP